MKTKSKWLICWLVGVLILFFGSGLAGAFATVDISGTVSCKLPAGEGKIFIIAFDGPDPGSANEIEWTSITEPGAYTMTGLPGTVDAYIFASWDMDGRSIEPNEPDIGDYVGEYEGNAVDPSLGNQSGIDIALVNPWVINHGTDGVYDNDDVADGVQNDAVLNIVQLTTNTYYDRLQCWGSYPWSTDGNWIVYQAYLGSSSNTYAEIFKVRPDGSGKTRLTFNDTCDSHASFTPDGKVVFQREGENGYARIWIMDGDGSNEVNLTTAHGGPVVDPEGDDGGMEGKPMVSPDGQKIAMRVSQAQLWAMDIDGLNPVYLANLSGDTHHSWGPDSQNVLFNAATGECGQRIFTVDIENPQGGGLLQLTGDDTMIVDENIETKAINIDVTEEDTFTVDEDGDFTALFAAGRDIRFNDDTEDTIESAVYDFDNDTTIVTVTGGGLDGFVQTSVYVQGAYDSGYRCDTWATWSPNGQWIAFHQNYKDSTSKGRGGTSSRRVSTLSIIKPDGTGLRHLMVQQTYTDIDEDDWGWICGPNSWSPDSRFIQFKMNNLDGRENIFLYDLATDEVIQLTEDYDDYRGWFSPAGNRIVFRDYGGTTRDGSTNSDDIMVINLAPWLGEEDVPEDMVNGTVDEDDDTVNAGDAGVQVEATDVTETDGALATILMARYDENPTGISFDGDFYDLYIDDPAGILEEIVLRIYYKDVTDPVPHWFDGNSWEDFDLVDYYTAGAPYSFEGVDDYDGYLEITLTNDTVPSVSDFTGTVVGLGNPKGSGDDGGTCFIGTLLR
jgi:Tol biopolymer transport system component